MVARILSSGPPKHAPMAIRGNPCRAMVKLATASINTQHGHTTHNSHGHTPLPPILLPHANIVIPSIPSDISITIPNT